VQAIERAGGRELLELRADGGATANAWLMQFQADVLGVPVVVAEVPETTALGAALLAGVGAGVWTQELVERERGGGRRYDPGMGDDERGALLHDWRRAMQRAKAWASG
jgi:glycerol kinase